MKGAEPNFLVVGAAKSGTTSLYHHLNQHPDIFMSPVKEPLFFCSADVDKAILEKELFPISLDDVVTEISAYRQLFAGAGDRKVRGEASVYYLLDHKKCIANIKKYLPGWRELRIVIILRNPVDACFSHYQMYSQFLKHFKKQESVLTLEESFEVEQQRLNDGYYALAHFHWFFFHEQVKDYLENFPNVKILFFEQLMNQPDALIKELYEFVGVDHTNSPVTANEKYNASGVPKSAFIYRLLVTDSPLRRVLRKALHLLLSKKTRQRLVNLIASRNMQVTHMNPETRRRLEDYYRADILKLQDLLKVDLSRWLDR